ncbi:unnamed protein product, partial [Ceratitis capitata]
MTGFMYSMKLLDILADYSIEMGYLTCYSELNLIENVKRFHANNRLFDNKDLRRTATITEWYNLGDNLCEGIDCH